MPERVKNIVRFDPTEHYGKNNTFFPTDLGREINRYGLSLAQLKANKENEINKDFSRVSLRALMKAGPEYFDDGLDPREVANELTRIFFDHMEKVCGYWKNPDIDYNLIFSVEPDFVA